MGNVNCPHNIPPSIACYICGLEAENKRLQAFNERLIRTLRYIRYTSACCAKLYETIATGFSTRDYGRSEAYTDVVAIIDYAELTEVSGDGGEKAAQESGAETEG